MTDSRQLAEEYDRTSDLQLAGGQRLFQRLVPGPRVLDVGCGTGRLARWMAEKGHDVTGIDPMEHRIAVARAHGSPARFDVGRAEDLSAFADASFDTVVLSSVIHWVHDKPRALAEVHRVLKPAGRVGLTTPPRELGHLGTVARLLRPLLTRAPSAGRACSSTELTQAVLDAGLDLVELHVTPTVTHFASAEAFIAFAEASAFGTIALQPAAFGPGPVVVQGWEALCVAQRSPLLAAEHQAFTSAGVQPDSSRP